MIVRSRIMQDNLYAAASFVFSAKTYFFPPLNMHIMHNMLYTIPHNTIYGNETAKDGNDITLLCGAFIPFMHYLYRIKCIIDNVLTVALMWRNKVLDIGKKHFLT